MGTCIAFYKPALRCFTNDFLALSLLVHKKTPAPIVIGTKQTMFSCCASSHKSSRSRRKHSCKQQSRHTCLCCLLGQSSPLLAVWRHRACLGTCRDHHCLPETADTHGEATGPWHTSLKTVMRSKVYWRLPTFWTAHKSSIKKIPRYCRAHYVSSTNCGAKNINRW